MIVDVVESATETDVVPTPSEVEHASSTPEARTTERASRKRARRLIACETTDSHRWFPIGRGAVGCDECRYLNH
jgi:hypothetical protein